MATLNQALQRQLDDTYAYQSGQVVTFAQYWEVLKFLKGYNPAAGGINSVVGGTDITVDNTDPLNPVINYTGTGNQNLDQVLFVGNTTDLTALFLSGADQSEIGPTAIATQNASTIIELAPSAAFTGIRVREVGVGDGILNGSQLLMSDGVVNSMVNSDGTATFDISATSADFFATNYNGKVGQDLTIQQDATQDLLIDPANAGDVVISNFITVGGTGSIFTGTIAFPDTGFTFADPTNFMTASGAGITVGVAGGGVFKINDTGDFGSIQTGKGLTTTSGLWMLGSVVVAASALDATQYLEVDVNGSLVKLCMST